MHNIITRFNLKGGTTLSLRAGVDTGTVTSGLVGRSTVVYDMWGDAVNLANQIQGLAGRPGIFVTGRIYDQMRDVVRFSPAGDIDTTPASSRCGGSRRTDHDRRRCTSRGSAGPSPSSSACRSGLVILTEAHTALVRRGSALARPVNLLRNYVLPSGALLILLTQASEISAEATPVRIIATVFGFVVLLVLLAAVNAALFTNAERGTWRQRIPSIFIDIVRLVIIIAGLAVLFSFVWGADVAGLFTALGVTSIVLGLALQNAVGSVISGLLLLFEQPFGWATGCRPRRRAAGWSRSTGGPCTSTPATGSRSCRTRPWPAPASPT